MLLSNKILHGTSQILSSRLQSFSLFESLGDSKSRSLDFQWNIDEFLKHLIKNYQPEKYNKNLMKNVNYRIPWKILLGKRFPQIQWVNTEQVIIGIQINKWMNVRMIRWGQDKQCIEIGISIEMRTPAMEWRGRDKFIWRVRSNKARAQTATTGTEREKEGREYLREFLLH